MILPPLSHTYSWPALRCDWHEARIKHVGKVQMARARVREGRFLLVRHRDVIVAIRRGRPGKLTLTYDTTNDQDVVTGNVLPFLTLYPGGVDLVSCYEYYDWPHGEGVWSGFTGKDLADVYLPHRFRDEIVKEVKKVMMPGWRIVDRGPLGPSIALPCLTNAGDTAICEVAANGISLYISDCLSYPDIDQSIHIYTLPAHNPDAHKLYVNVPPQIAHQARALLRWYRRALFDAAVESEMI